MEPTKTSVISKYFADTISLINPILIRHKWTITSDIPVLNKKEALISRTANELRFSFLLLASNGDAQKVSSIPNENKKPYQITSPKGQTFTVTEGNSFFGFVQANQNPDFKVTGSISQLYSDPVADLNNKFHRLLIPVPDVHFSFVDFEHRNFKSDINAGNSELIEVNFKDLHFHLISIKINKKKFWGVDSLQQMEHRKFLLAANTILQAYGFLKGDLHLNEGFTICSDNIEFQGSLNLHYTALSESLLTGYGMITYNPVSALMAYAENSGVSAKDEMEKGGWNKMLAKFSLEHFSKLCDLFYEHEGLSRASVVILQANVSRPEVKAAAYCVAFESICHVIEELFAKKCPPVIEKKMFNKSVKPAIDEVLNKLKLDGVIDEKQFKVLNNKLNDWNRPTNTDTLTAPFKLLNYKLSEEEKKCISNRNNFLHGRMPVDHRKNEKAFLELHYISIMLHRLLYILILKVIGYKGYIKNYPKIHEDITGVKQKDGVLLLI
ncbi:hypothetical protein [Taibaiella soli]|uniref:ApeA N-terminal domain-containing protein n=1 Tax=Taibaiella soli TaxID=1649169 RepID=A0A2W2BUS7_9BACT|nr:hypothetical protein [Taibaiella soli]PZF71573.1 hypothetical protein DN068_15985 [Taibaiella soli]